MQKYNNHHKNDNNLHNKIRHNLLYRFRYRQNTPQNRLLYQNSHLDM
ncbi:MAG: hypothetical protein IJQ05_00890 [Bacteroidaceae bacterium]|nr:hypothetical protein [Bacteroidaceae bacterium]